jgi:hypothetical protein
MRAYARILAAMRILAGMRVCRVVDGHDLFQPKYFTDSTFHAVVLRAALHSNPRKETTHYHIVLK